MYTIHGSSILPHSYFFLSNDTIAGGKDLEEVELPHLDGHKGSRPVRIGNGAANHIQLVSKTNTVILELAHMNSRLGHLW